MRGIGSKSSHSEGFLETPSSLRRGEVSTNLEAAATPQTETQSSFSQPTPEIQFSLLTPVVYFYTWDHLGTVRLITNSSCAVVSKHDFEPYGVELLFLGNNGEGGNPYEKYKYTGQERDPFTNFDYMHFRFYASSMGRFLKPDNVVPSAFNPQSWNLYTYVNGNPVNFNDPSGHYCKAGGTSQVLFGPGGALGLSAAYGGMWENSQEKGTMLGTAVGFEGTAEFSGTETIEGYWKYVPQWAENIATGEGSFVENGMVGDVATAQQVSETGMVVHGATWVYVSYGGGGINTGYSAGRESLWERWKYNFLRTNKAIPGLLAPTGLGTLTGKTISQGLETPTLWQWVKSGFRGIPAAGIEWTSLETFLLGSGTLIVNTMAVGVAFEVGVAVGSLIQVVIIEPLKPE